jgi:hypothetical protein
MKKKKKIKKSKSYTFIHENDITNHVIVLTEQFAELQILIRNFLLSNLQLYIFQITKLPEWKY